MAWKPNPVMPPLPPDDEPIWRYMDLSKFLYLVEEKKLYFSLSKDLEDKWEGHVPAADLQLLEETYGSETTDFLKGEFQYTLSCGAVNCWHRNEGESVAMWSLYTQAPYGVAIRSSVGRLKRALEATPIEVELGVVKYRDLADTSSPSLNLDFVLIQLFFFQKRTCYQHENELRAFTLAPPKNPRTDWDSDYHEPEKGMLIDVSLADLIDSVYLGPGFPNWAEKLIDSALKRAGIKPPITHSSALSRPSPEKAQISNL